jgi:hypothetical protein
MFWGRGREILALATPSPLWKSGFIFSPTYLTCGGLTPWEDPTAGEAPLPDWNVQPNCSTCAFGHAT